MGGVFEGGGGRGRGPGCAKMRARKRRGGQRQKKARVAAAIAGRGTKRRRGGGAFLAFHISPEAFFPVLSSSSLSSGRRRRRAPQGATKFSIFLLPRGAALVDMLPPPKTEGERGKKTLLCFPSKAALRNPSSSTSLPCWNP